MRRKEFARKEGRKLVEPSEWARASQFRELTRISVICVNAVFHFFRKDLNHFTSLSTLDVECSMFSPLPSVEIHSEQMGGNDPSRCVLRCRRYFLFRRRRLDEFGRYPSPRNAGINCR